MAQQASKTLLPEPFAVTNDFKNYIAHFELLTQFQEWQRKETVSGAETIFDEWQHYFVLRLQKLAFDIYRTHS